MAYNNYFILTLVILGLILVAIKRYEYLQNTSGPERTKRKIFWGLTVAFATLVGITSIFAEAIFEFLELQKPANFEWLAFAAFAILAWAGVKLSSSSTVNEGKKDKVAGDKLTRDSIDISGDGNAVIKDINNSNIQINSSSKKAPD